MSELDDCRRQINEIDAQLVSLFEQRMNAAKKIGDYKRANNLPIYDPRREEAIIARGTALLKNPELAPYYQEWYKTAIKVSRDYQNDLLKKAGK